MLLLKGDYDDMLPQPSPAPGVGLSPPPPSPTCEQLHNIRAWYKLTSTVHVLCSCMKTQCVYISEYLH